MSANKAELFIKMLQTQGADVDYIRTDDLGPHYVNWVERTPKDGGPCGIWFYVDEINLKIVVEHIGAQAIGAQHE